jgi:Holliday junction resolvase-like predicted endonuclease
MKAKQRIIKNRREQLVMEKYISQGYEFLKKGWPDFLFYKGDKIILVEVKRKQKRPSKKRGLSGAQRKMQDILSKYFKFIIEYVE